MGRGETTATRVHVDERALNKGIGCETVGENVGMDLSSELEVRGRREGLEKEREGVEVGSNVVQLHSKVYG